MGLEMEESSNVVLKSEHRTLVIRPHPQAHLVALQELKLRKEQRGGLHAKLYSPYWIVNKSEFNLKYSVSCKKCLINNYKCYYTA